MSRIVIIGASRGPGYLLFNELKHAGRQVLGMARHPGEAEMLALDAADPANVISQIENEDQVIFCTRPELLSGLLKAGLKCRQLIAIGSTRIFTRFPDAKYQALRKMESDLGQSDLPATIIHPTMIYGAPGLNNIERIEKVSRYSPWIPLPAGGKSKIQPVHAADVVSAIIACLDESHEGETYVIAGEAPLEYREFVELTVAASGHASRVISMPLGLVQALAFFTRYIPFVPSITSEEVQRLMEDKAFSNDKVISELGITPRSFEVGLNSR